MPVAETDFKATLALPKTDFPMKANLPKREAEILKRWDATGLYDRMLEARKDAPLFVLHDGPPYANGEVHVGTALNKILKDFIVRSRAMMGRKTPFVPGWDCHGMPIECKVSRKLGAKARTMPSLNCASCAARTPRNISIFSVRISRRLGRHRRLAQSVYLTLDPAYDAAEIGVLRDLVENGYVYRGLRPVHWCFAAAPHWRKPRSNITTIARHRFMSPSAQRQSDRSGEHCGRHPRTQLLARPCQEQAFRRHLDDHAMDAARQPRHLASTPAFEYVALESGDKYLYRGGAARRGGRQKACGLAVEKRGADRAVRR